MKEIGGILVDDNDFELLSRYDWKLNAGGYAIASILGNPILMHRLILNCPVGMVVDHIDGNRRNNQKKNLRIVTNAENSLNRRHSKNYIKTLAGTFRAFLVYRGHTKTCATHPTKEQAENTLKQEREFRYILHCFCKEHPDLDFLDTWYRMRWFEDDSRWQCTRYNKTEKQNIMHGYAGPGKAKDLLTSYYHGKDRHESLTGEFGYIYAPRLAKFF